MNFKKVHRLWKQEGLAVPRKARKRRRLGCAENGITRRRAQYKNHVWGIDFIFDRDERQRSLKWLSVIDEYTRECLMLAVERSITAEDVVDLLVKLFKERGMPDHIRSDNGPEFIAAAIKRMTALTGIESLYIEPGSP